MIVIGISGKKRTGKNTVAKLIATLAAAPCEEFSFAAPLKKEIALMCKVPLAEVEENKEWYRPLLQAWGMYHRQKDGEMYWIERVGRLILKSSAEVCIITDVRFKNEADFVRKCGGVVVRVNRLSLANDEHCSEVELDSDKFDFVLDNNSTLNNLREDVKRLLHNLKVTMKQ